MIKDSAELVAWLIAAGPQPESGFALGTVENLSPLNISFEGEVDDAGNRIVNPTTIVRLDSVFPSGGDRVLMMHVGNTWVIIDTLTVNSPVWQPLSSFYQGNVADYGGTFSLGQFTKIGGIVYIRGQMKATGTVAAASDIIVGLPTGYGFSHPVGATDGDMFSASLARGGALQSMRLQVHGYSIRLGFPALALNDNFNLTGIQWIADE